MDQDNIYCKFLRYDVVHEVFKVIGCCDSYNDLVAEDASRDFNDRAQKVYEKNADNMAKSWKAMCARHGVHWNMYVVADRARENIKALGVNFVSCMCHGFNNALKFAIAYATQDPLSSLSLLKDSCHKIGKYEFNHAISMSPRVCNLRYVRYRHIKVDIVAKNGLMYQKGIGAPLDIRYDSHVSEMNDVRTCFNKLHVMSYGVREHEDLEQLLQHLDLMALDQILSAFEPIMSAIVSSKRLLAN